VDDRISISELLILGLWLGAPAFILGLAVEGIFLWRMGLGRPSRRLRLWITLLTSGVLSYLLTFALWVAIPQWLKGWPERFGDQAFMFVGVFLVPAVLALAIVCPPASWLALRKHRGSPTSGCS
jgi:hypothetical protein